MLKTLFLSSFVLIYACANKSDKSKLQQNTSIQWEYLTLSFNDTIIRLSQFIDTLEVAVFEKEIKKYQINKVEKDSVAEQSNELMDFKEQPKRFCTDYVGKLKVRIKYNSQLTKEVTFSSICNWQELNDNTSSIDRLLKNVIIPNR